ncbi:hypothetical protein GO003_005940 [Methylicorpusculum oleiharenae]|uniref:hypothetical protein n=1 Tax=Methylicorpusculum oleiharenae TaxID=1338687 RepID=UPI0013567EA2|nr:hypothetical protein [Methylicorpusculum oleiharenae]MCD2449925.1 hypothetical protein [Methylicorpusculum oleiharenae]
MKAKSEKASATMPAMAASRPFIAKAGEAGFFEPAMPSRKNGVAEQGFTMAQSTAVPPPAEVTSLKSALFAPAPATARHIDSGKRKGAVIKVSFGTFAKGEIKVRKNQEAYETVDTGQLPIVIPVLKPLQEAGIPLILAVKIKKNLIEGYLALAGKGVPSKKSFLKTLGEGTHILGWQGLQFKAFADNAINAISGGALQFSQNDIPVRLGGFLDSKFSVGLTDDRLRFDGNGQANIPGLQPTPFRVALASDGKIRGEVSTGVTFKNFSGAVRLKFIDGLIDGQGDVRYSTEKLAGLFHIVLTDQKTARGIAFGVIPPEQLNKTALDQAGLQSTDQSAEPKPGPRAIAGTGTLNFAFNEWLSGMALVVVDGEGHVTVVSEIRPQKEVILFRPKAFPESGPKTLFSAGPKFRYGVPYVADIHVGIDVALTAWAVLGPGLLRNIAVKGTYSTDPLIFNQFALSADLYIQAQAELALALEASAGITILFHDIDVGAGIKGALVLKAYVEGTPTIGYREKADPEQGKKGEFFIKGSAVAVAQPFFALKGYLFVDLDSPRLSPAPDKRWTWPMLDKEYPLGSGWGIGITVGGPEGYVLGSGKPLEVDLNKAQFDGSAFIDNVVDDSVPKKQARSSAPKNRFSDQIKGQAPPPELSQPTVSIAGDGKKSKKQKAPTDAKLTEKWMNAVSKGLLPLPQKANKKPFDEMGLTRELNRLRSRFDFTTISARKAGDNWLVVAEMYDRNNKNNPLALKGAPNKESKTEPLIKGETVQGDNGLSERVNTGLKALAQVTEGYIRQGATEEELTVAVNAVRRKFSFKAIRLFKKNAYWYYAYELNPKGELQGPQVKTETAKDPAYKLLAVGTWIEILNPQTQKRAYERVISSVNVIRRSSSGESKAASFITDKLEGGRVTHSYADEGIKWKRSPIPFTHPSQYVMPAGHGAKFVLKPKYHNGDFIRTQFYKDTSSSRKKMVKNKLPDLRVDHADAQHFFSEAPVAQEVAQGYPVINGKAVVPVTEASPDHDPPIAKHWSKIQGNNTGQISRENWNRNPKTYTLMSLKLNLHLGSRGEEYTPEIGINFKGPNE